MSRSTQAGSTPLEGAEVLSEVAGETGVLLWKTLRAVRLWATASREERAAALFAPGARQRREEEIRAGGVAEELARPLRDLAALLEPAAAMSRERVVAACGLVGGWARASGELATASAFSGAAALASPDDADLELQVARDARAQGDLTEADRRCRRTMLVGRRTSNWDAYVRAVLILAIMARGRGRYPVSRGLAKRGLALASRHRLPEPRAIALHELFMVATRCDGFAVARRYLDRAYRAYGLSNPAVLYLSHDLYATWVMRGQFERALPALREILPLLAERERLTAASNVVRAAGGMGDGREFRRAWAVAVPMLETRQTHGCSAASLLSLAYGATGVGEWELASTTAEHARAIAEKKGEWELVFAAQRTLDCISNRRSALPVAR